MRLLRRLLGAPGFALRYFVDLVRAALHVARLVLTPTRRFRSAVVGYPLADDLTDDEVTIMANLVTLSPGTLSLELSADRRTLYVHVMDLEDGPDAIRAELRAGLEEPLRRWWRGRPPRRKRYAS